MSNCRPLTEAEQAELDALTKAINDALKARRKWLDAKMVECSRLKVGDDIYDVDSGTRLGKVTKLYRFHTDRNDLYDDDHYCSYEYETGRRCYDNTSRQPGRSFGTREDAIQRAETRAAMLRRGLR